MIKGMPVESITGNELNNYMLHPGISSINDIITCIKNEILKLNGKKIINFHVKAESTFKITEMAYKLKHEIDLLILRLKNTKK